jgi:hypothetical protein
MICHACGSYYEGSYCPNHGTAKPLINPTDPPDPAGTISDAIRQGAKEIMEDHRKTVRAVLQVAIHLIQAADDTKEAEKMVQKLLDVY